MTRHRCDFAAEAAEPELGLVGWCRLAALFLLVGTRPVALRSGAYLLAIKQAGAGRLAHP